MVTSTVLHGWILAPSNDLSFLAFYHRLLVFHSSHISSKNQTYRPYRFFLIFIFVGLLRRRLHYDNTCLSVYNYTLCCKNILCLKKYVTITKFGLRLFLKSGFESSFFFLLLLFINRTNKKMLLCEHLKAYPISGFSGAVTNFSISGSCFLTKSYLGSRWWFLAFEFLQLIYILVTKTFVRVITGAGCITN